MKHIISLSFSLIFALWLLHPHVGSIFKSEAQDKYFQNRNLYAFPNLEIDSILSSSFGKDIDNYIWDHLRFRAFFLKVDHWIDYHVFKDSPLPDMILLGKDNWLFFNTSINIEPEKNLEQVERFAKSVRFAAILEENTGLDILFVSSPTKFSIYPEFLSDSDLQDFNRFFSIFRTRLEDIASDTDDILLLWDSFLMEKDRLSRQLSHGSENRERPRYIFAPGGDHYDWELSILQAKCIVEKLAPGKWKDNIFEDYLAPYRLEQAELARLIKIRIPDLTRSFNNDAFFQTFAIKHTALEQSNGVLHTYTTGKNPYIDPLPFRIMVIHDSFMQKSYPFLLPYFKETILVNWADIKHVYAPTINALHTADILIIQRVESLWYNRYDLLERILNELALHSTDSTLIKHREH